MYRIRKQLIAAVCLIGFAGSAMAIAPDFIDKLGAEARPEKERDGARRPYQVMQVLGVEEGMTAVDIGAGGGWWTWVFSAAVGPDGTVYAQGRMRGDASALEALGNVQIAPEMSMIADNSVDAAVTALNIHHFNADRAGPYMADILRILKPGGVAAIIDHVGVAGNNNAGLHRVLVEDVRAWIEASGLEIVEESNLLRTNADDHTLSASDPILGRNPDRFLFVVRNPG